MGIGIFVLEDNNLPTIFFLTSKHKCICIFLLIRPNQHEGLNKLSIQDHRSILCQQYLERIKIYNNETLKSNITLSSARQPESTKTALPTPCPRSTFRSPSSSTASSSWSSSWPWPSPPWSSSPPAPTSTTATTTPAAAARTRRPTIRRAHERSRPGVGGRRKGKTAVVCRACRAVSASCTTTNFVLWHTAGLILFASKRTRRAVADNSIDGWPARGTVRPSFPRASRACKVCCWNSMGRRVWRRLCWAGFRLRLWPWYRKYT